MFPRVPGFVPVAPVTPVAPTALLAGPGRASSPVFTAGAAAFTTLGPRGASGTE
jgi:hypothetical protein